MTDEESSSGPAHDPGTRKGEEMGAGDAEAGREGTGTNPAGRGTGKATSRFSTGVNSDDEQPIDEASPELPPA